MRVTVDLDVDVSLSINVAVAAEPTVIRMMRLAGTDLGQGLGS
jgi:hypothetical protein